MEQNKASPAALTDAQRKALEVASLDYETRGYDSLPRLLRSILAAQPAETAHPDQEPITYLMRDCSGALRFGNFGHPGHFPVYARADRQGVALTNSREIAVSDDPLCNVCGCKTTNPWIDHRGCDSRASSSQGVALSDEREAFEAAWRAQYPDHGLTVFLRSLHDNTRYTNTRTQDGWLMWQARAILSRASSSRAEVDSAAARDVLTERRRQVTAEGWTPEHDDEHSASEMSLAAACYAMAAGGYAKGQTPPIWPWSLEWWKPSYGRRDLIKAGALILAEIERIDRLAAAEAPNGEGK